jgi:mRNA interferase MazF
MVMRRGEIRIVTRPGTGGQQPVLVVQENEFNDSHLPTVVCAVISANLRLAHAPGNVFLSQSASGLAKESVANVAQLVTVKRKYLSKPVGVLGGRLLREVDEGLRLVVAV